MELPREIADTVESGRAAVIAHPVHDLDPTYRGAIYGGIAQLPQRQAEAVRFCLDLMAVRRSSSVWRLPPHMIGDDDADIETWLRMPEFLADLAESVIERTANREEAIRRSMDLAEEDAFTGQPSNSPYFFEWCAFKAARLLLAEALEPDKNLHMLNVESLPDMVAAEEEVSSADIALLAGLAEVGVACHWKPVDPNEWRFDSNGMRWLPSAKDWYFNSLGSWNCGTAAANLRRKDYWLWWLGDAISNAWALAA